RAGSPHRGGPHAADHRTCSWRPRRPPLSAWRGTVVWRTVRSSLGPRPRPDRGADEIEAPLQRLDLVAITAEPLVQFRGQGLDHGAHARVELEHPRLAGLLHLLPQAL